MRYLITGGAGFIGCNVADFLLSRGEDVVILDDLSRRLSFLNLEWLKERHPDNLRFVRGDVRQADTVAEAVSASDVVFHLAGQVAVTTSVVDPRGDFEVNALGTLNVLEAARLSGTRPAIVFASTNKVYGKMQNVEIDEHESRYAFRDIEGCAESQPLDFYSPYGCSKGAADQYVRDYARMYGLKTLVFRQSCIYGPRQFGVEDQGWAAHFVIAALAGRPVTIYGDGKQVRDMLYVDDLIECYFRGLERIDQVSGSVYNVGGGPANAISVWREFRPILERISGHDLVASYRDWRPGDQPVYISDITKAERELGWRPRTGLRDGIERLARWVVENREAFAALYEPGGSVPEAWSSVDPEEASGLAG